MLHRTVLLALALALVLGSLCDPSSAQGFVTNHPTHGLAPFETRARFVNTVGVRRIEWCLATIPFPEGVFTPGKTFYVPGTTSELTPFGGPWPDGSWRYGQLAVLLDLAPNEEKIITVREGAPNTGTFVVSPWVAFGQQSFDLAIMVGIGGGPQTRVPMNQSVLTRNDAARLTAHTRGRHPGTDLIFDLWLTSFSDQDHMQFELRVTNSRVGSPVWEQAIDSIDLCVTGASVNVRAAPARGVTVLPQTTMGPNVVQLLTDQTMYDGQGQEWVGELIFYHPTVPITSGRPVAARTTTLIALPLYPSIWGISLDWGTSGAFGPFGYIPPDPPWVLDGGRFANEEQRSRFEDFASEAGDPFRNWPFGLGKEPSLPGQQYDFGAAKLLQIFASGLPHGIEEARLNASEEACRPVHFREVNGGRVLPAQHPNWVVWDGRTHWDRNISPDRLGKPYPAPALTPAEANGWKGRDNEHWSSLCLASAYLLTGSDSLRYELNTEADLYVASNTLPSTHPGIPNSDIGAARAVGRTLLSMSWNYLCTGDARLKSHMIARVNEVLSGAPGLNVTGPVNPISLRAADPRTVNRQHWRPWEEGQAALGLEACAIVTGDPLSHQLAEMTARTVAVFGWNPAPSAFIVGTGIGWKANGQPLTLAEYLDPNWVSWGWGSSFNEWTLSATRLAERFARETNNIPLLTQSGFLLGILATKRFKPLGCEWDTYSEWEAVK